VPAFQQLQRIQGGWPEIHSRLSELVAAGSQAWLEILYESNEAAGDLRERLDALITGTSMEILRIRNEHLANHMLHQSRAGETLEDLDAEEVFRRCLVANAVPEGEWPELMHAYREILLSLHEDDPLAE